MKFNLDSPEFNSEQPVAVAPDTTEAKTEKAKRTTKSLVELLAKHGGIYQILDEEFMNARLTQFVSQHPHLTDHIAQNRAQLRLTAQQMFKHLSDQLTGDRKYTIHSPLMSHLTFPQEGRTFTRCGMPNDNEKIPAFLTFVGQFIDHDLTLNPLNLFDAQGNVNNDASAVIDLDSVYGRHSMVSHTIPGSDDISNDDPNYQLFNHFGRFRLRTLEPDNAYDLTRDTLPGHENQAFINDLRNDENKIILQIHILLIRLHNKLASTCPDQPDPGDDESVRNFIATVRKEVARNWQSFILNEYLPAVVSDEPRNWVLGEIVKPGFGNLKHKPEADSTVKIPHEFSIGFRMGHSQLRDKYHLNPSYLPIVLFDNRNALPNDLRGGKALEPHQVISWPFFSSPALPSNKIDSNVTCVVFDLPESTIPDKVKQVGNLPQRNLIRSSQVELAAAEDLIELYELETQQLTPMQIEGDPDKRRLFKFDNDGNYRQDYPFRTPLWYYILKEAEYINCGGQLGPLGGRIITEVIAGGIYYNPDSFVHDNAWASKITGTNVVKFKDIVDFVTE